MRQRVLAVVAGVLLLAGCGTNEPTGGQTDLPPEAGATADASVDVVACESVVADAGGAETGPAVPEDLWPAFDACTSVEDFAAAVDEHPGVLGGEDPAAFVEDQCDSEPDISETLLCRSL